MFTPYFTKLATIAVMLLMATETELAAQPGSNMRTSQPAPRANIRPAATRPAPAVKTGSAKRPSDARGGRTPRVVPARPSGTYFVPPGAPDLSAAPPRMGFMGHVVPGYGIVIDQLIYGTPAARAGLENGDVILQINGHPIRSQEDYVSSLNASGGRGQMLVRDVRTGTLVVAPFQLEAPAGPIGPQPPDDQPPGDNNPVDPDDNDAGPNADGANGDQGASPDGYAARRQTPKRSRMPTRSAANR